MSSSIENIVSLYDDDDGYGELSARDRQRIREARSSAVYGEITPAAAQTLIEYLDLGNKDVFYDLGSGVGRLIMHAAMESQAKRLVGVELSATRNKQAKKVFEKAKSNKMLKCKNVEFWCADIMRRRFDDATYVYTCSTAFPERFFNKLVNRLSILKSGVVFISLNEIENKKIKHFIEIDRLRLDMSWQKRSPVYVYQRV